MPSIAQDRRAASAHEATGELSEAIGLYQKICLSRQSRFEDFSKLARLLAASGNYEQVAQVHRAIAGRYLGSYETNLAAAASFKAVDDADSAIMHLARAIALDSGREKARAEISDLGVRDEQQVDLHCMRASLAGPGATVVKPSVFSILSALSLQPLMRLARSKRRKRQWSGAIDFYARVLSKTPQNAALLMQMGHALREAGRPAESVAYYRRAVLFAPREFDHYLHLGHVLKALERRKSALYAYLTAYMLNPGFEGAARELAAEQEILSGRLHRDMEYVASLITGERMIHVHESGGFSSDDARHNTLMGEVRKVFEGSAKARMIAQCLVGSIHIRDL